jgi:hypothetical protein
MCPYIDTSPFMANRRFISLSMALVIGVVMALASPCAAQWTLLKTFSQATVASVYFLDQVGVSTTGLVGLDNSAIWRTTDNGVTWNQAVTPLTPIPAEITDFTFHTSLLGWCSVRDDYGIVGGIWKTTDGGQTWISVLNGDSFVSVGYCQGTNMLSAPCWYSSAYQSTDLGATWTSFASDWQNGVSYSGLNGVIGNLMSLSPLYSNDGGITWNAAPSLDAETWSPYGIPGTNTFVAVGEKTRQFFISTNGGSVWTNTSFLPPIGIPTGCIRGTTSALYVQSDSIAGFYYSTDTGNSWVNICGPSNFRDTRFYAVGPQIFAGDFYGGLWYTANAVAGGTVTLHLDETNIQFSGTRCDQLDTTLHITSSTGCVSGVLVKAQMLSGAQEFSFQGITYPYSLTGSDSIGIIYTPSPSLKDSGKLLLEFNLGTRTVDTIITLYGTAKSTASYSVTPSLVLSAPYACVSKDTTILIHNYSCDTLSLTGASLTDSSHFELPHIKLPHAIGPGGVDTVPITSSSLLDGTFTSELELHLLGAKSVSIEDSVSLALTVFQGAHAEIGALSLSVLDACTSIDTVISITATPCDSIVLQQVSLSDTSIFHLGSVSVPTVIPASGKVQIDLHGSPGNKGLYSTSVRLQYLSGSQTIDTTVPLTLQVLYDIPVRVGLRDSLFSLGVVNVPCASTSQWVTISNSLCRNLSIQNIAWENADSEFWFDPISFPVILASDTGIDSILVHFKPNLADTITNRLQITLDLNGTTVDTFITISGEGVSSFHDSILTPALSYDTVLACQSKIQKGQIVNLSCDSVVVTSATFTTGINYILLSPIFPVTLAPDSTLDVQVELQPTQNGLIGDGLLVTLQDPVTGNNHIETISLEGFVIPNSGKLTLSSSAFSFPGLSPCSSVDTSIILTNDGYCSDIIIADTTFAGYPGVVFTLPDKLPIDIPPDSSVRIGFHIIPAADTSVSTTLALRGQNVDTLIALNYASLSGGNALAFSTPDSDFITRPCFPVSKIFWIANVGCNATSVDTIAIPSNQTQFTLDSLLKFPEVITPGDTLFYTVQFDPSGSGSGAASLNVRSRQARYDRSLGLTGSAIGIVPTARITLESSVQSTHITGKAGGTTDVAAIVLDNIGDTTGLETVSFTLDANWDLLSLTKIATATGWSIADTFWNLDHSLEIRLRYTSGGSVLAGTQIAHCYFAIAVTDSAGCDIVMSGLRFNDSSANYDGCILSSIQGAGDVRFTSIDTCGTPILRSLLQGQVALQILSVRPNPVNLSGSTSHIDLSLALAQEGIVTVRITDMLGREVWHQAIQCTAGTQTLPLDLPTIPEGSFFMEASSQGISDSRKIIVEAGSGKE